MQISTHNRQPSVGTLSIPTRAQVSDNPIDRLPDLATLEARASEVTMTTPMPETPSAPSQGRKAALLALGLGTALVAAAPSAHAYGYGYHHHYDNYNYGGGDTSAIIGGAIVGAIIGGIMQQQAPPVYYPPQPVYQTPFYDGYNRLICPTQHGGWYVSPDNVRCW
ncbi:hypothetical protein IV102_14120 [bacterium]|nr:hypothetical protein [bacterium]